MKFGIPKPSLNKKRSIWFYALLIGLAFSVIATIGRLLRPVPDQSIIAFFISGTITFTLFAWFSIYLFRKLLKLDSSGKQASRKIEKPAWHSVNQSVYHNNPACLAGKNIDSANKRLGTGAKTLCENCANLNQHK